MHFKIVVDNQIRIFDCKETLTLEALSAYVRKAFPKLRSFSFYYIDQEGDQIILQTKEDVNVYLETYQKMPRIYVKKVQSEIEVFDSASRITEHVLLKDDTISSQDKKVQIKELDEVFQGQVKAQQKEKEDKQEQTKHEQAPQKIEKKTDIMGQNQKNIQQLPSSMVHKVICDNCGAYPIIGIRYKCGVCQNYDQCESCRAKSKHNLEHPFVKIRDSNCAPLDLQVQLKLSGSGIKNQRGNNKEKELKNQGEQSSRKLVYETENERILLIISILESMFGPEHSLDYFEFAKATREQSDQKICESFANWMSTKRQNTGFKKVITWFKNAAAKAQQKFSNLLSMNSD